MGIVWLYTNPARISQYFIMNSFVVFATLLATACAAPQVGLKTVVEGPQTGPLTPLVGNLVQTPKGLRPIDLEGFSEDLDQDGFVDPVVPAAPAPIVAPAPVFAPAPVAARFAAPAFLPQAVAAPIQPAALPVTLPARFAAPFPAFHAAPVAFPSPVATAEVVKTEITPAEVKTVAAPAPVALPFAHHVPFVAPHVAAPRVHPLPVPVRASPSAYVYDHRSY